MARGLRSVSIPLALSALLPASLICSPRAEAFFPKTSYTVAGALGSSHQAITERALAIILDRTYGVARLSSANEQAIAAMTTGNAAVDEDQGRSQLHFDAENFKGGFRILVEERSRALAAIRVYDATAARTALGRSLHTLQDFYSHSSWLDQGNGVPFDLLTNPGDSGLPGASASLSAADASWDGLISRPTDAACGSCVANVIPICNDCSSYVVG